MAPHASSVTLCLFDGDDASGERRFALHSLGQGLWAGHVPGVGVGQRYGYRVAGRWAPELGLLHNPAKLLLDPYAKAVTRAPILDGALFSPGFSLDRSRILDPDPLDSAPFMSLGVVTEPEESVTHHPRIPWRNTVIYECHVKGITALCEGIPEELRGTYAGLAHPAAVDYLKRLGITAVELLPIQAKMDETFLADIGLTNYWGYSTLDFFAPEPSYATQAAQEAGPQAVIDEVKGMVAALHEAGIRPHCWRGPKCTASSMDSLFSAISVLSVSVPGVTTRTTLRSTGPLPAPAAPASPTCSQMATASPSRMSRAR